MLAGKIATPERGDGLITSTHFSHEYTQHLMKLQARNQVVYRVGSKIFKKKAKEISQNINRSHLANETTIILTYLNILSFASKFSTTIMY